MAKVIKPLVQAGKNLLVAGKNAGKKAVESGKAGWEKVATAAGANTKTYQSRMANTLGGSDGAEIAKEYTSLPRQMLKGAAKDAALAQSTRDAANMELSRRNRRNAVIASGAALGVGGAAGAGIMASRSQSKKRAAAIAAE